MSDRARHRPDPGAPLRRESAPAAPGACGFSLIEMLAVLVIVTLLL
ncbi:MAG: prepilin-type N-terminal cleavage/methylation domain-containing protein, partial [Phycisphaerales bacterium]|nr:prepilin-type N-terminal cleavage/methylation domain-containing protein [Phycisphaerales bacterium]